MGLVAMKAAIGRMREGYAFSERGACRLLGVAASSCRYQPRREDGELRERLQRLARADILPDQLLSVAPPPSSLRRCHRGRLESCSPETTEGPYAAGARARSTICRAA